MNFKGVVFGIAMILLLAGPVAAQVVPPPPIKPPVKPIVLLTITAQGGELVVIDASKAKGDVDFDFDVAVFSVKHAQVSGKKLFLAMPKSAEARTLYVVVISWEDRTRDRVAITIAGEMAPKPKPPPLDALARLEAKMDAGFARLDAEIAALKGPRPPPVPIDGIAVAIQGAWQQEFAADKADVAKKMAQCYLAGSDKIASASSWGELSGAIRAKAQELGIAGKLPAVSKAINAQLLAAGFPASPSVLLGAGDADKARGVLAKVVGALEVLP